MKTYRYIPFFIALLMSTLVACKKDFLNVVPKGSQVAKTTNDYDLLLNSSSQYLLSFNTSEAIMGDDIAQEATGFTDATLIFQKSFRWEDNIFLPADRQSLISSLYTYNKIINEVMEAKEGTEQQKKAILAEARANRAWIYFRLINIYGKPYMAANAGTDLGFPIIKIADITQGGYVRNTVQEVYDFIITDLSAAIPDLPVQSKFATRFSKVAAEGLLGKVYLFMGKNTDALSQLNAAFTHIAAQTTPAKLYNYNVEFNTGGKFLPITSNGPSNSPWVNTNDFTESVLAKAFYNDYTFGSITGWNGYVVLSPSARALFGSTDLRLKFYGAFFMPGTPNPSGRLARYAAQFGRHGLQLPELYLLRAEVKARLNDLSGAITDTETLRKARMPLADATIPSVTAGNQTALIKFIIDERGREFAMEGYRWFDMRRLSVDPLFSGQTYTHILYKDETSVNPTVFTLRSERLTFRLPPYIMAANPQFQDNP